MSRPVSVARTALLLLFADPTSDALDSLSKRIHISEFYVSFVLAPFASNVSERIAAYHFAQEKTQKSIEVAARPSHQNCSRRSTHKIRFTY